MEGQGTSTPTSSQAEQAQGTFKLTSSQAVQGQTGQSSPHGPQAPNAYEAEIFNNEVPTVILYHKSMHLYFPDKHALSHENIHNKQGKLVIPKVCTNAHFCFRWGIIISIN